MDIRGVFEEISFLPVGQEEHLLLEDHGMVTVSGKNRTSAGQHPLSPWNETQGSNDGSTLPSRRLSQARVQC